MRKEPETKLSTRKRVRNGLWLAVGWMSASLLPAAAGEVHVEKVRFAGGASGVWTVYATLRHGDTGWDHYADAWRVVDAEGRELGVRTLYHPHVDEQPFTRSLGGVRIPPDIRTVFVEARDKIHGWSDDRVEVHLDKASGPRFTVTR